MARLTSAEKESCETAPRVESRLARTFKAFSYRDFRLLWAGEKVRPEYPLPSPTVDKSEMLEPGKHVVSLAGLVLMKLMSNRDQDRVHLRDLIEVGLVGRDMMPSLLPELAARLDALLTEAGR